MKVVKANEAEWYPNACIVTNRGDGELIDTGQDFEPNPQYERVHVYLLKGLVEQWAVEFCGMSPRAEVDALRSRCDAMAAESKDLHEKLEALETLQGLFKTEKEEANGTPV